MNCTETPQGCVFNPIQGHGLPSARCWHAIMCTAGISLASKGGGDTMSLAPKIKKELY